MTTRAISRAQALQRTIRPAPPRCSHRSIATVPAVETPHNGSFPPPPPTSPTSDRKATVRNAKPFSDFLTDTFNRQHDYLRISLTERCNLRCLYCMPEEGIELSPSKDILTTAEIYYLSALFVNQGVNKIRLTGGEPTVRKDIIPLMQQIGSLRRSGLKELALTTNGISLHRKLDAMVEAGLTGVNISLDTLDPFQFQLLTRRQGFDAVMKSITRVQEMNKLGAGIKLKINCVAMRGLNDPQIVPFVEMTRDQDIEVRFIEYMPFGGNKWSQNKMLPYSEMLDLIRAKYPDIARMQDARNDTSKTWQVPGFKGRFGFITSMTHNFCGTCNRLRITSDGNLKVCLHGNTEVSLRDLLRNDHGGEPMDEAAFESIRQIELDRRKAPRDMQHGTQEGWISKERQLLDVIRAAVKRKQAKHAGMGTLENMPNRPMILIGEQVSSRKRTQPMSTFHTSPANPLQPWLQLPAHLLSSSMCDSHQTRLFSSTPRPRAESSSDSDDDAKDDDGSHEPSQSGLFGFQSLSGLFSQPVKRRYSRPRRERELRERDEELASDENGKRRVEPGEKAKEDVESSAKEAQQTNNGFWNAMQEDGQQPSGSASTEGPDEFQASGFFLRKPGSPSGASASRSASPKRTAAATAEGSTFFRPSPAGEAANITGSPIAAPQVDAAPSPSSVRNVPSGRDADETDKDLDLLLAKEVPMREHDATGTDKRPPLKRRLREKAAGSYSPRVRNPFSGEEVGSGLHKRKNEVHQFSEASLPSGAMKDGPKPWGLSERVEAIATANTEASLPTVESSPFTPAIESKSGDHSYTPVAALKERDSPSTKIVDFKSPKTLTHLTSSGEAHMVDVGAKAATKRVAIAYAYVRFTNPAPFSLIFENTNKKGDVLGTARIAGIMAAKRTSDLIPLCHPIALTKVEVEVTLRPPGTVEYGTPQPSPYGGVAIVAQVQCTGPTGVEMEALTAVTGAALTVYDMCKAVDSWTKLLRTQVVYKSGGRSGTFVDNQFVHHVGGTPWFTERRLDLPEDAAHLVSNVTEGDRERTKQPRPPVRRTDKHPGAGQRMHIKTHYVSGGRAVEP